MSESTDRAGVAALENALAALTPAAGPLDRDRLMFRAGQASLGRRRWLWPAASAALAVVAAGLGSILALHLAIPAVRPAEKIQIVERTVYVKVKEPAPPLPIAVKEQPGPTLFEPPTREADDVPPQTTSNAQLQKQLLRWGLDGLPGLPPAAPGRSAPVNRLLDRPGVAPVDPVWSPLTILTRLRGSP